MTERKGYEKNKSNKEFLQGVYQKIEALEKEERELEKVHTAKRKLWKKRIKLSCAALVVNLPFIVMLPEMLSPGNQHLVMGWSFLLITLGSFIQYSSEVKGDINGN